MAINLELPRKLQAVIVKTHQGVAELVRPIARKYDEKEHAYPVELDTLISMFEGASESFSFAGAGELRGAEAKEDNHNGANMAALVQTMEASWGDVAMMLSIPYQGLGNAATPPSPPTSSWSAWARCGRRWLSPSRDSGRTPQRYLRRRRWTATST